MKISNSLCFLSLCFIFVTCAEFRFTLADSDTYIIHMDSSAMPKAFSGYHSWYSSVLSSISGGVESSSSSNFLSSSKLVYAYNTAINGFSAVLSASELEAIKQSPGYVSSTRDAMVEIDTTASFQFLGLNSNHGAWPVSNYGADVIVGLVDTGVWPESKSFNDDAMSEIPPRWGGECESGTQFNSSTCNKKLIGARYFNKGLLAKNPNLNISMNSCRDTEGHGTHTSSTAAGGSVEGATFFGYATGTARGMAPKARVAMYKALWAEGSYISDVIAAIDAAIADGVDVLSMSFGLDGVMLYSDPVAIATFAAIEKGIFVSTSTSSGNLGPFTASLHNGIPWVLTVAAGTIDRTFQGTLTLGNGATATGESLNQGNSSSSGYPLVFLGACDDANAFNKTEGKIAVCLDTNDTLSDQVFLVRTAKVAGGVFISNQDVSSYLKTQFPAIFVKLEQGKKIMDYVKNNLDPKASFKFPETLIGTKPAPKLASYSSRGPSQSCPNVLKPDLMAPGDLILASWPANLPVTRGSSGKLFTNFNILSGTSMATPHAAGVAALVKGAHPDWSPGAIRSALMTTAYVLDNTGSPIKDIASVNEPADPLGMGSGHIDPNRALNPGLVYDASKEDYINLLCGMNFTPNQIRSITRSNSYNCSNASLDLNYPSFIAYFNGEGKNIKVFQRIVTNMGDGGSIYTAKLTAFSGFKVSVSPDRLEFNQKYEKRGYKLTIEGQKQMDAQSSVYGFLTWTETNGRYIVRSPIVIANLDFN